jgi:hypothetical protein
MNANGSSQTRLTSNSTLADPSADPHAAADAVAASGATTGPTAASGHSHDETAATSATGDTGATGGADAHSHGTVIAGTATGKSPCEVASPTPASPGQVGAGEGGSATPEDPAGEHGGRGMLVQTPVTKAERVLLEQQMAQARTVIAKYPTAKDAVAAGYRMSTPYVPCIGAHYTNYGLVLKFDPATPSELLYDGTKPDSKIVGLSFLVYHRGGPPDGFAGSNDHWHQHNANGGLCFGKAGIVIGGEDQTREECAARWRSASSPTSGWRTRVVPGFECSWGVFAGECPSSGARPAAPPGTDARPVRRRAQPNGDQLAVLSNRLSQSSHFERVVHPGARALHVRRQLHGEQPGRRSGWSTRQQARLRAGGRRARPGTPRAARQRRELCCSRLGVVRAPSRGTCRASFVRPRCLP